MILRAARKLTRPLHFGIGGIAPPNQNGDGRIPYEMFEQERTVREVKAARQLSRMYHKGQDKAWEGEVLLQELVEKHGGVRLEPEKLEPKDHGLFAFSDPNDPQNPVNESDTIRLKPGFLESSNVKPMQEMTRLIEVIRAYESNQRVIQSHDQRIGQVISGLGNPVF